MSEQDRLQLLASSDLLSISEAAELTPYSADYLSLRARQGRLPAIKVARNWLTTRKAVLLYVQAQARKHQKILRMLQEAERGVA